MKKTILWLVIAVLSFTAGFYVSDYTDNSSEKVLNAQHPLLAKRLFIDNPNDINFDFRGLEDSISKDIIAAYGENSKRITVYFEYLPSGVSVSINPDLRVIAASLMKTAIAMQIYKIVERGQLNLEDKVVLKEEFLNSGYGDLYKVGAGAEYSVSELIEILLTKSDNTAAEALKSLLVNKIYSLDLTDALDIDTQLNSDQRYIISSEDYSKVFKCLYLSCYNTKDHSQEILEILTNTTFTDRITKLLPDDLTVAHKIGSFDDEFQSDCGIVYANDGNSNYLLCIMLNAQDPEASEEIARISYRTYSYVKTLFEEQMITK